MSSRLFRALPGAVLVAGFLAGCLTPTPAPFELRADRAFFWEGTPPGEDEPRLYLLGSMHLLDQPIVLGPQMERALESSDVLAVEVDIRGFGPEKLTSGFRLYGGLPGDKSLEDVVAWETIVAFEGWLDHHDTPVEQRNALYRFQPWVIATLVEQVAFAEQGARSDFGVDLYFLEHIGSGTRVVGLETLEEQFFAFSSHSPAIQESLLKEALGSDPSKLNVSPLLDAWKNGDAAALAALAFPNPEVNAEFFETIYYARSQLMADGILELLEAEPGTTCFAVVGAGHLVGESTVIDLLEAEGYRMRRTQRTGSPR